MASFDSIIQIQKNIASRLSQEVKMDKTLSLMMIIQGLVPDRFGRVQKELVILEAIQQGMSEEEVFSIIHSMIKDGTVKEQGEYLIL